MTAVELEDVTKDYPGGVRVLDRVRFTLGEGESVAVVGSSGCGKSTLLNIIGTLDHATSGRVRLFGDDVGGKGENARAGLRAKRIGFVFQMHHLLPQCSVLENVLVPTLALPGDPAANRSRAEGLLKRVGLVARLRHLPAQLSGGERQRTALVRALINRPKLLLADEPTGALDGANADGLAELLTELNREEGVAVVLVTHDHRLARRIGPVYTLGGGKLTGGPEREP